MLVELYGSKVTQAFGDRPGPMWRKVIEELTDLEIENGIEALMNAASAFPPSLPEFRAACQSTDAVDVAEDAVQLLAYELIPSFDRRNLSRIALEHIARRNLDKARALLQGVEQATGREKAVIERLGLDRKDLVRAQPK